jgi:hypothetical protein
MAYKEGLVVMEKKSLVILIASTIFVCIIILSLRSYFVFSAFTTYVLLFLAIMLPYVYYQIKRLIAIRERLKEDGEY